MITTLKRLPGNTVELTLTLPWSEIDITYQKIFASLLETIELPGFRKGKAPKELAQKHIDKTKVYEEILKEVIPHAYAKAVKEQNLRPIISPRIEVLEADEKKDWKVRAETCETPGINLGEYQKTVQKLKSEKKPKIWLPGERKDIKKEEESITVGELLDGLHETIKVDLSPLLIEQEVNRMLSHLVDELAKLGLTVEQYLASGGKTSESLRKEYTDKAVKTLSLEFALEKIADNEKVTVEDKEIEEIVKGAKTPQEREQLEKQRYYISSLLRRQKTLKKLLESPVIQ